MLRTTRHSFFTSLPSMRMPSMQHVAVCCWALQVQVAALNAKTGIVVVCGSNTTAREYDRNLCVILSGTLVGTLVADATLLLEQVALPQQMAQHRKCQPGLRQLAAGSWLAEAWRLACLSCSATHRHEACAVRPICLIMRLMLERHVHAAQQVYSGAAGLCTACVMCTGTGCMKP